MKVPFPWTGHLVEGMALTYFEQHEGATCRLGDLPSCVLLLYLELSLVPAKSVSLPNTQGHVGFREMDGYSLFK